AAAEAAARAAATNLVFFYNIRVVNFDEEDDAKLQELVKYVNSNKVNMIYIKGYADKGTGNPYVNRKYAKQRAENVKKALVNKYGIDSKMIECLSYGDTVQPYPENDKNRCATIFVEFE
ncbi:MAG: OmpA family protein, partial [Bacteroidales bacterium]|nr:OmpA family protein [Bacteroidales bacterium]